MKKLLATAALVALIASPAFAQNSPKRHVAKHAATVQQSQTSAFGRSEARAHSANPAHDVYDRSRYVGSDPDARIRQDLLRDEGVTD